MTHTTIAVVHIFCIAVAVICMLGVLGHANVMFSLDM